MAREYAGFLGSLGMAVVLARGAFHGAGVEGTILQSVLALGALAVAGLVAGAIAESVVDEAVRQKLEERLSELDSSVAT